MIVIVFQFFVLVLVSCLVEGFVEWQEYFGYQGFGIYVGFLGVGNLLYCFGSYVGVYRVVGLGLVFESIYYGQC